MTNNIRELNNIELGQVAGGFGIGFGGSPEMGIGGGSGNPAIPIWGGGSPIIPIPGSGGGHDWWIPNPGKP